MTFDLSFLLVIAILFLSTFIRSTFGFGNALVAMPLLAMVLDMKSTTPLVALVAFSIALTIIIGSFRSIRVKSVWRLIVSSLIGIPIGLIFLKNVDENIVKFILAVIIISVSVYNLIKPKLFELTHDRFAYFFGFFAGLLGGAYNTDGPPIVIYATLRRWPPEDFRATLQGYFLPTAFFITAGHGLSGLWTPPVIKYFLFSLPLVFLAIFLGGRLNKMIPAEKFIKYIYIFLIIVGLFLLYGIFS